MFDLAKVVLGGNERFEAKVEIEDREKVKTLYRCRQDQSLWLNQGDVIRHFMAGDWVKDFYAIEETAVEPPKGEFKSIAVCGISGILLGPPNHHSYQTAVVRLHRKRFANMPIDRYKSRIRTETSEEMVEKWKESQSKVTHYRFPKEAVEGEEQRHIVSPEELERHVQSTLLDQVVEEVTHGVVPGNSSGKKADPGLLALMRREVEQLRRSPFPLVKVLCGTLESQGLKIFKRQGKKLFVSKARPRPVDPETVLSDSIRKIVEAIQAQPGLKVSELVTSVAPRKEGTEAPEGHEFTAEERSVLSDLHWLIDEGYIIEYVSSALFLGGGSRDNRRSKPKEKRRRKDSPPPESAESKTQEEQTQPAADSSTGTTENTGPESTAGEEAPPAESSDLHS